MNKTAGLSLTETCYLFLVKVTTMSKRPHSTATKSSDDFFRLKPLVAGIRIVIAGGLFAGTVAPVHAELPIPGVAAVGITPSMPWVGSGAATNEIIHNATNPDASTDTLRINQSTPKVTLNWQSFNVGKDNTVQFVQPDASSIALNRIHQGDPSQILGHVTANGQIYLVNQNGFVFGNGSVVDANSLVASALNISDDVFAKGIIRVFDQNRDQSGLDQAAMNGTGTVNPNAKVEIAAGAKIKAGQNGNVILVAPTVDNSGSISTDKQGQILLVASQDKVYLQPTSSNDPFAGLLVEVGNGGNVTNTATGDISVRQGNVTLAGFAVNQSGRISATTSVSANGSVRLLARENPTTVPSVKQKVNGVDSYYLKPTADTQTVRNSGAGNEEMSAVTMGPNSSITVLADVDGGSAIDEQAQNQSIVEVSAAKIDMKSGSAIVATSGKVSLTATDNVYALSSANTDPNLKGTKGHINLDRGASIDVSGSKDVQVAMERNIANISVQSFNLRDAPYQRGGVLQGQTVQVDIRNLPTIIDASSATASIQRGINERLALGTSQGKDSNGKDLGHNGEVNLQSSGDVAVKSGAVIDISGGAVSYQDGYINTSNLLSTTGRIVDIAKADPNEQYAAIFGIVTEAHSKWGVTNTWNMIGQLNSGRFEQGYTEGKPGGALNIFSPLADWKGELIAGAVSSIYQRSQPVSGGSFTVIMNDSGGQFLSNQNVVFSDIALQTSDLMLSPLLINKSGIRNLTVKTWGNVTLAADAALSMPVLSNINIEAANINVKGSLYTAGGTIKLKGTDLLTIDANGKLNTGYINLDAQSVLDVSGKWVNDFQNGLTSGLNTNVAIDAGIVTVTADNGLNFKQSSTIKADGGTWLDSTGILTNRNYGNAGTINLSAGTKSTSAVLNVDGSLSAYGLTQGGTLSLTSNKIIIGAKPTIGDQLLNLGVTNGVLDVNANSGFNNIKLISNIDNVTIKANTEVTLISQNRILDSNYRNQASSNSITGFSHVASLDEKPEYLRKPVSLSLTGQTGVTLETGSKIKVDNSSTVNLTAENLGKGIYIDGTIEAQAGNINLHLDVKAGGVPSLAYDGLQAIWLGTNAYLNVQGTAVLNPIDVLGRSVGTVKSGGNVTIQADRGYVVLEKDLVHEKSSVINVSGTNAVFDLPATNSGGLGIQSNRQVIGSDAGKIKITSAEGMVLDGTLIAHAGSATNRGGVLDLTLDRNQRAEQDNTFPMNRLQFNVVQDASVMLPTNTNGQTTISASKITTAGFDQLRLAVPLQNLNSFNLDPITNLPFNPIPGVIQLSGNVDLNTASSLIFDSPIINWDANGALTGKDPFTGKDRVNLNLKSTYLQLGSTTYNTIIGESDPLAASGGILTTNATWTQLNGALLIKGLKEINLNSYHDLRAVGVQGNETSNSTKIKPEDLAANRILTGGLSTAANINLTASQIYPTTLTQYTFNVTNPSGELTVSGSNTDVTPLSAAGKLTLNATTINQNGVLKAPLGTIELIASGSLTFGGGSLTSVSAEGNNIPFGQIVNNAWQYSLASNVNLVFNQSLNNPNTNLQEYLPLGEKHLVFKSPDIQFKTGSIIDVSGGGNLLATQFQPGLGGSFDYLQPGSPSYLGGFAILPTLRSSLAPFDPNMYSGFDYNPGATIHLNGAGALAAGDYAILPAYYALLPGAYLVTPQTKTQDQILTSFTKSGLPIVSGYQVYQTVAGTQPEIGKPVNTDKNNRDSRTSGYLIETSAQVQKHSTYDIQSANSFFAQQASNTNTAVPLLPQDSGQISIDASTKLVLEGQFNVASANGRGAKLDISSKDIKVVNTLSTTTTSGELELLDTSLSKLNVDSLFLGGKRESDRLTGNTNLTVTADKVIFNQDTKVEALDLIVAAKNKVEVMNGATITSAGKVNTGDHTLVIESREIGVKNSEKLISDVVIPDKVVVQRGNETIIVKKSDQLPSDIVITDEVVVLSSDAALLRISSDNQVAINRANLRGVEGDLSIATGSKLTSTKSMLLDGSKSTVLDGDIAMQGGALTLTANTINFGEITGAHPNDLNLTNQKLPSLAVDDLILNSRGSINFYGNVRNQDSLAPIHFNNLLLDAAALSGFNNTGKVTNLQANKISLGNSQGVTPGLIGNGLGRLDLLANLYTQETGNFAINGFNTVNINGVSFNANGNSVLTVDSDLNLNMGSMSTTGGSSLKLDAGNHDLRLGSSGDVSVTGSNNFGGSMEFIGNSILYGANTDLPSGKLSLHAYGTSISKDTQAFKVADITGWNINDVLSGSGINTGTKIVSIDQVGKIVTIDSPMNKAIPVGTLITDATTHSDKTILMAMDAITISSVAKIDLSGKAVAFADMIDYTPGGTFSAIADNGSVNLVTGSKLDLSTGGGSAAGGNLILKAANEIVSLNGQLTATGGSAIIDVNNASNFDSLMSAINKAGVSNSLYFRSRDTTGITEAASTVINANNITLVADNGAIDIYGKNNANGIAQSGSINIYSGDKVTLYSKSQLTASGAIGGNVLLSSVDSNNNGISGIELKPESLIDVTGTLGNGGTVTLSALRTPTGINIQSIADGTVTGAKNFYAEGVKKYTNADFSTTPGDQYQITAADITAINTDTTNYMTATNIANVANLGGGIRLRPGIEINYTGDLTMASAWDFSTKRFGVNLDPGSFVIRSTGNLNVNKSITDGFNGTALSNGKSWSLQLVSGADLSSADNFVTATANDLTIGTGVSVHTGSGDIKLASGGDLKFADQTSTIYNAGRADLVSPIGTLPTGKLPIGAYPIAGGELLIRAGGNIEGAVSNQFLTGWFNTIGTYTSAALFSGKRLSAWAVNASQFQQNIGSFGGGIVDISASGNINDLSVMMPTTGKQMGTLTSSSIINKVQIQGGGQMTVSAGGEITGGAYYLGKGNGVITAGGQITGSNSIAPNAFTAGPQLVMSGNQSDSIAGDTNFSLNAGKGIKISAVSDGMVLKKVAGSASSNNSEFFTYTEKSKLAFKSLSGDIHLNADTSVITSLLGITNAFEQQLSTIYPASLDVTAFGGSVKFDSNIVLFPSVVSNLNLLANQGINTSNGACVASLCSIMMSDADPKLLPNVDLIIISDGAQTPGGKLLENTANKFYSNNTIINTHALNPIHSLDTMPARVVSQTGDIASIQVILPKQSIIQAGRDLINSPLQLQQINLNDSSIISANRDIVFATNLDVNGTPTNNSLYQIAISGLGNALIKTGRNLDLGTSTGLTTVGNSINPALPIAGANLDVLVGLNGGTPSYSAFINKYLLINPLYAKQLAQVETLITAFMQQRTGNIALSQSDAMKAFGELTGDQTLPIQPQLNAVLNGVFFNELKLAGSASAANKSAGNQGGYTAINTLFPGNQWQGDLKVFFSKLQTLNGGDINLMVPGGLINAGLAVSPDSVKTADQLGIVTQRTGNINAFVKNDFTVNTSRVFTLGGGDILIWSSEGNIDAGKGAKSALSVTMDPPFYDANDKLVYPVPKITSGSGIRTAASLGVPAGNVFLFAPKGVVDAGEAGIGGSNVTISATAVLGANNIQVSGTSSGVPVASVGSVAAGLTGTSNVTANASQTAQAAMGADEKDKVDNKNMTLGMLSVELLGFGE